MDGGTYNLGQPTGPVTAAVPDVASWRHTWPRELGRWLEIGKQLFSNPIGNETKRQLPSTWEGQECKLTTLPSGCRNLLSQEGLVIMTVLSQTSGRCSVEGTSR